MKNKILALILTVLCVSCTNVNAPQKKSYTIKHVENRVNADGVSYCPNNRHCLDVSMLPPTPCVQPYPSYYGSMTELERKKGILLIHPITRAEALCLDDKVTPILDCVNHFKNQGYVLITDIPTQTANYDMLQTNTYPARRWRNGGEVVPRW